jgi:hypothetical protein
MPDKCRASSCQLRAFWNGAVARGVMLGNAGLPGMFVILTRLFPVQKN